MQPPNRFISRTVRTTRPQTHRAQSTNRPESPSADLHSHPTDSHQTSIYTSPHETNRSTNRKHCPPYRSTRKDSHPTDNSQQASTAYSPIPTYSPHDSHPMYAPKDTPKHACHAPPSPTPPPTATDMPRLPAHRATPKKFTASYQLTPTTGKSGALRRSSSQNGGSTYPVASTN